MNSKKKSYLLACLVSLTLIAGLVYTTAEAQHQKQDGSDKEANGQQNSGRTLVANRGQIAKMVVESPSGDDVVLLVNQANDAADVDFVAFDADGNEVGRETVAVGSKLNRKVNLQTVFPELLFSGLSTVELQSSVQPSVKDDGLIKTQGAIVPLRQLAVAFFSQRDSTWSTKRLGTCTGTTIGSAGCAISCVAMAGARKVSNFNPGTLNTYLTSNGGYASGCLIAWSVAAKIDGATGFTYIGTGTVGTAANLKSIIDGDKFAIAKSTRFSSGHYGIIIGYDGLGTKLSDFYYLDPWDLTATFRRVNDGFISGSSATQIYR